MYCIFDDVLHVKLIFNAGVTSTYLGCTLMEHFYDSLVFIETILNLDLGGGGCCAVVAKTHRLENSYYMLHFRQAYTGTRSD
jgi:hypothetical protein